MSYLISIKTAILVFPLIACLFSIPFVLHQYHKYGSINPLRVLIVYSFILYMITIYFLVILPLPDRSEVIYKPNMVRLIPFGFISDIIRESSFVLTNPATYIKALKEPCFYTVIFNIFMTIPFGMYLRYYFKCDLKKTIIISFCLSLFFEITQLTGLYFFYPHPYRVFDVDDLIMNTLGGGVGYFLMGIIDNFLPTRDEIDKESFKDGEVVSGFRRVTIFALDLFLYTFLTLFVSLFVRMSYLIYITFIIYYVVYPYFKNGETLGSKFLGVRLEFGKYKLIKLLLRIIFLFTYYFGSLFILLFIVSFIAEVMSLEIFETTWFYIVTILSILLFYLINILILIKNKEMFYDNLFKVKYRNTIKEKYNQYEDNSISG